MLMAVLAFAALCAAGPARAGDPLAADAVAPDMAASHAAAIPEFPQSRVVAVERTDGTPDPVWAGSVLLGNVRGTHALASVEKPGIPTFDPSCGSWFASANGSLVRVTDSGALEVVADDVQGVDVDVRMEAGVAVSREPDDTIVLIQLSDRGRTRTVLASGPYLFHPRLSPDGSVVLLSRSGPQGGGILLVKRGGQLRQIASGYGPAFTPDGKGVVFARVVHDGLRVTASDLFLVDIATGTETSLPATDGVAEAEPAVSSDGRWLGFVDALSGTVRVSRVPRVLGGKAEVAP
jgi:hypothetical protein